MATTSPIHKTTESAHVDDEVRTIRGLLVDELATIILHEGTPVTVWEVAAELGDGYTEQASAILDGLTTKVILARFRVGCNNYYAPPTLALTEKGPTLKAIISNSLKGLFLSCRYKLARHLK